MAPDYETLIEDAKRGNDDAFYQLMDGHKSRLYRIAYSYLKNEADALEAIQETTYRAYSQINKLRNNQYFGTWLVRILLNYCTNEYQRRKRFFPLETQKKEPSVKENDDMRLTLEQAVSDLEPKYQQIIILKYFEDLTLTEVARVMNRPEGTVKTWLHKALQTLRLKIGKEW
jgi:RNA polymerase sigma-70 factor (TIGR02954 family)